MRLVNPENWPLVASLSDNWKARLSKFRELNDTLYFTTFDRRVFAYGANHHGLLGVGHKLSTNDEPVELPEFRKQDVIDFNGGINFRVALTKSGLVYTWNGRDILVPRLVENLPEPFESIKCGAYFTAALTKEKRLYAWGLFSDEHLTKPTFVGPKEFRVERILSTVPKLILLEYGKQIIYEYRPFKKIYLMMNGENSLIRTIHSYFQLNLNKSILIADLYQSCLYPWNIAYYVESGQMTETYNHKIVHFHKEKEQISSKLNCKINVINIEYGQLVKNCRDHLLYMGDSEGYGKFKRHPEVLFPDSSVGDAIGVYAKYKISPFMLSIYEPNDNDNDNIINPNCDNLLYDNFDQPEDSDVIFQFDNLTIYGHRQWLSLVSEYMRVRLSDNWLHSPVIKITEYSYELYYRYLMFLYTRNVKIRNMQEIVDLYDLANSHLEIELKKHLIKILEERMTIHNVRYIFEFSIQYEETELSQKAAIFIKNLNSQIPPEFIEEMSEFMVKKLLFWVLNTN